MDEPVKHWVFNENLNQIQLWFKLTNLIWANVLKDHELYTGYDVEDTTPGYGRDPITKDTCLKAQDVLNKLFEEGLLSNCQTVIASPDGGIEFEWYAGIDFSITIPDSKDPSQDLIAGPFEGGHFKTIISVYDVRSQIKDVINQFEKNKLLKIREGYNV